jgi:hypothetical protein
MTFDQVMNPEAHEDDQVSVRFKAEPGEIVLELVQCGEAYATKEIPLEEWVRMTRTLEGLAV